MKFPLKIPLLEITRFFKQDVEAANNVRSVWLTNTDSHSQQDAANYSPDPTASLEAWKNYINYIKFTIGVNFY